MYLKSNRLLAGIILIAFIAGVAFSGGILFASGRLWLNPVLAIFRSSQDDQGNTGQEAVLPGVGPSTIAETVTKAGPAVVKIETLVTSQDREWDPFFNDPFFREFFGHQFVFPPKTRVQRGLGSGFLISPDGYILTNEHVIEGAQEIHVTLAGRTKPIKAQVVGADRELDLTVLKVNAGSNLPFLELGDSDRVAVGNWVIAIGNPYGLDHTVTVGVISAKGRPVTVQDRGYRNLLQTDASINPGNSGGPLLNLQGKVVGINTAVSAQAQGISFAIPSNTVKEVLEDLMKKGKVSRGWLGVEIQEVTPAVADYFGLSNLEGVVIKDVVSRSPAQEAGLRRGDIILAWNGNKVRDTEDLLQKIQQAGPGKKVQLTVWRDRRAYQISVNLGERP